MAKILIVIVAAIACFYLVESLTCNKCSASLFGKCDGQSNETCSTNTSVCYSTKGEFSVVKDFTGFIMHGCVESAKCPNNSVSTSSKLPGDFLNLGYTIKTTCCNTDKCNKVTISGATANTMSLTAALSVAALAAVWGSFM